MEGLTKFITVDNHGGVKVGDLQKEHGVEDSGEAEVHNRLSGSSDAGWS